MLAAAAEEKIDLILTKEVSRFARNTVDTLAYTRLLRRQGVGIVFIGDHIDTRQNDGEFRLTIMASVAQEESRKISERVKWGQQRSMERGVVFGCDNIYGFSLQGGELTVNHPLRGHSFELRLTCEDPAKNLAPSSGTLASLRWPSGPGIRVDSGVVEGDTIRRNSIR